MVQRILAGETINGVARELNVLGIPTATGKEWNHTLVRQILVKPRIAGMRSHNGATHPGNFPGIITAHEWELLQLALAELRRAWPGPDTGAATGQGRGPLAAAGSRDLRSQWTSW